MTTRPFDLRSHALVLAWLVLVTPSVAQTAPATSPKPPSTASASSTTTETTIELSPFEVRAEGDVGYQAANTTSGSRLNSRLKDTPASVSAFTPEFLSDIAATNLEEMLAHATNIEIEVEDSNAGFNNPQGRGADGNDYQFRMRGSPAGASRDFVESNIPVDLYNVERAEVASGPNSILFGLGQAGGLVSLSGKKANLSRERTTLKSIFGSWSYERYEGDHNQVLIPRKLSVRLIGMYQNNEGWRHWDFNDSARWTVATAYRPFNDTTIHASFERGLTDNSLTLGWNGVDQVTGWLDNGSPTFDGTASRPGTQRLNATNQRFTFNEQDGIVYNYRGAFQSVGHNLNAAGTSVETLLPPSVSPYEYSLTGPGGVRHQTFQNRQVMVQQKLPWNINLELAWFRNTTDVEAHGFNGVTMRGDPNNSLPQPDGAAGTITNPFAGQLYFEGTAFKDRLKTDNEVFRLSAAIELGKSERWFGRHRVAGLAETSSLERYRRVGLEILVDDANVPIVNPASAEGAQNMLTRRNYIVPGDFTTYYSTDPSIPVAPFTWNGRNVHATYASRQRANTHTFKDVNSFMLASQSFWFKDRLVTTLGARRDDIEFQNAQEARMTDRNDPRVQSGEIAAGEWFFPGPYNTKNYELETFTAGAVLHATRRLSLFYNLSRNNGAPRFDRTVLPDGDVGPPIEGRGRDFGFMFDFFGDDRFFVRTTWFETKQLNDTPILPGSDALGVDNLADMLTALRTAGKISQADYDRQAITWSSTIIDVLTEGIEVEVVANPTKNLSLRASYSHSERRRANFFHEIFAFFGERIPQWRQLLQNNPVELREFEDAVETLDSELAAQVDRQNAPFATRPHKMNGTARYRFSEGRLRGLFLGGSVRYQGKNYMNHDVANQRIYWGNETLLGDAFMGYRFRVPRSKLNATVQLNVKNVTNSYRANPGRLNDIYTGLRRVYLTEPRSWRLTTTLEF